MNGSELFPVDWYAWHDRWIEWRDVNVGSRLIPSSWRWVGMHPLADEVLGRWSIPSPQHHGGGCQVELSEVTMFNHRYVGVTYADGSGQHAGAVVGSFDDLDTELFGDTHDNTHDNNQEGALT